MYLDYLLILSSSFDEHVVHLTEVASCLRKAGLTINVSKSEFCLYEFNYWDYVERRGTLSTDPEKATGFRWYRKFIPDFSTVTFHLTELLKKGKDFVWWPLAQQSFENIKQRRSKAPFLIHPDYSKHFVVQCGASQCGVGALLVQGDEEGHERPIAYMSQNLNKANRNYTVSEIECLLVILAIKKFRMSFGSLVLEMGDESCLKWLDGR